MPLQIRSSTDGERARLVMVGTLDAAGAQALHDAVEVALTAKPAWLEFDVEEVDFMSSAGLRVVIFAKQRAPAVKIAFRNPRPAIVDTLRKTGFLDAVYLLDTSPPA